MGYRIECDTLEELRALLGQGAPPTFTASASQRARPADLSAWLPPVDKMPPFDRTAAELGITAQELAQARRRSSDVASLSQPIPAFEDDPLGAEQAEGPGLTDKARAEFAAATAPKGDEHAS